ncbi:MAG: diaminopimelate decarboxylase [Eubacteriales bacterium]|mgnify:CR=1 FL=1|nr:diaminopimelate decarboxylase [Clostridiales bacterium]
MIQPCLGINADGRLTVAGRDAVSLAEKYGTPAYFIDEETVRRNCRIYKSALAKYAPSGSFPLYAGKALCCASIYRIVAEEGLGADVVSPGEIATAVKAGFPMERAYFHGNSKTDADIRYAIEVGVGTFVVDNFDELEALDRIAGELGVRQRILLRLSPGIDPQTHRKIITGSVDSKFGVAIETGQAIKFAQLALAKKNLQLDGLHCHIGSQIFEPDPFVDAAEIMVAFAKECVDTLGWAPQVLNLGGGFAVRYIDDHPHIDIEANVKAVCEAVTSSCAETGLPVPRILLEPGRSIVANAGVTLYTVGSVKHITGYKSYVSVDGGMTDNPRYALYSSPYTIIVANRAAEPADFECTVAGRCCESGDLLAEGIKIQRCERGDILAVCCTGAYNYSMASNYNRIPRPPIIVLSPNGDYVAVERETNSDIVKLDNVR